ncbi:galactosylgalactosylxylosylprotein 3-beta-glucuronosyltransferase S-like [Ornithodoros turicata]|uniref:galactosylgalactosylxylosylprotein 3-beta-glucuronosyltransferase S-like n=1 Tax=Ornithodoros turicata TaxID=34597 RepID=UPI0031387310
MEKRSLNIGTIFCTAFCCFAFWHLLRKLPHRKPTTVPDSGKLQRGITIYVVTPTYYRALQIPELVRLSQTLILVENLHWVVVEDSYSLRPKVAQVLEESGLSFTHLVGPKPTEYSRVWKYGRGVSNRLRALEWIRQNASLPGVLYFADDDNAYDVRLFEEIRKTRRVSVFPVGLMANMGVSTPIVYMGKVVGFHDPSAGRVFMVDMAGFAVNLAVLMGVHPVMNYTAGLLEETFLQSLKITVEDLEPLANNCTEVLVWHTQTLNPLLGNTSRSIPVNQYPNSNLNELAKALSY